MAPRCRPQDECKSIAGQSSMRLEQSSRLEDSNPAVEERENSNAIPPPPYKECCPEKDAARRLVLSELNQADSMHLLRGMLFSSGSDTHGNPSLNLNATNANVTDRTKSQKIVSTPSETWVIESTQDAHPTSVADLVQRRDLLDSPRLDIETSLIDFVCHDNAEALVCLLRKIVQVSNEAMARKAEDFQAVLGFWFPHRLLHLSCQLDSVACAQALLGGVAGLSSPVNVVDDNGKTALHHAASNLSTRCIELLLQKRAKPDLSSHDSCTPLKLALQNKRWPTDLQTLPAVETIRFFRTQDLTIIKLLACHTKGVLRLACHLAFDGHSPALTALIIATGNSLLGEDHKYESFLDLVVERALSRGTGLLESQKNCKSLAKTFDSSESESEANRYSVLKCLEIIVCLKKELECSSSHPACQPQKTKPSALLRAAQAGDETVIKILLMDKTYIHETDADGNTALHWCLKTTKGLRIIWQLVTLGSAVTARNKLGYTPVHVAAGQGHLQALQLLLAQDPNAVHIVAVTRETPLFLAVKNNHIDCVKLLLQFGSNLQTLNLRRQRPVDFANSQDMRMLLSENGTSSIGKVKPKPDSKSFSTTLQIQQPQAVQGLTNLESGPTIDMRINKFINSQDDLDDSNWLLKAQHAKTALCRYHMMPGGCARGEGCFYAHSEQELRSEVQVKAKITDASNQKKIFVGGLSPAIGSDDLKDCFEAEFGPVEEAIVMSTQTGGHIQSRGFGFVTFVKEASCIAAVRQHYLIIYGKRVEIKAAFQPSKKTNEDTLDIHSPKPPRLVSHDQDTSKDVSCSSMPKGETSIIPKGEAAASTYNAEITPSSPPSTYRPPWLPVFKKWLPAFLSAASTRQRGAELYPLSSVKADFRATCGMELDHAALGFPKLSDFLRTMPELCRMKIVPVGRGPATHVVLQLRQQQNLMPRPPQPMTATNFLTSSLVHEGRTYAAAASQNITTSSGDDNAVQDFEKAVPMDTQPVKNNIESNEYKTCDFSAGVSIYNGQQQTRKTSDNSCLLLTSDRKEPDQTLKEKVPTGEAFTAWQQEFSGNNLAMRHLQPQLANALMTHESSHPDTPATQPPQQQNLLSFLDVYHNPYMEQTIPFSPFQNSAVPSYKQGAVSLYNPWNFNVFEGCRNLIQQMNLAATGEESPQSSLTSDDSLDSLCGFTETPPIPCIICGDKAAVWVALPCAHKAICSPCKHQLHKNQSLQQCFVCQGRTREWMAQY